MEKRIGVFTPQRAKEISDYVRRLQNSNILRADTSRAKEATPPSTYLYVYNDSGTDIPLGGCFQVAALDTAFGESFPRALQITDSVGDNGTYFFSEYGIPQDTVGLASIAPIVRARCSSSTPGFASPKVGTFDLEPNDQGPFRILGEDDLDTGLVKVCVYPIPTNTKSIIHARSPLAGIPGRSGLAMGSALCDLYDCDSSGNLSDSGDNVTIYNMAAGTVAGYTLIMAAKNQAGLYVCIVEDCD